MQNFKQAANHILETEPNVSAEVLEGLLDDQIDLWHANPSYNMPLYEFLGLSKDEFAQMIEWQISLPHSIQGRIK